MKKETPSLSAYSREVVTNMLKPGSCLAWAGKAQGIPPGHEALLHTDQKFTPTFSWHTPGTLLAHQSHYKWLDISLSFLFRSTFSLGTELVWCKEDQRLHRSREKVVLPTKPAPPRFLPPAMFLWTAPMPCLCLKGRGWPQTTCRKQDTVEL